MSFFNEFESRIGSIFGAAPQGYTEPFSFKKLAKRAAKEMERETYEIDGVDTAPALYTVLVSSSDDSLMRPLYHQITFETAAFVEAEARKKGYDFVGDPLVRFMVDPQLKSGKFAVFAENVDADTLSDLREEEMAFLGANASVGGAAASAQRRPQAKRAAAAPAATPAASAAPAAAAAAAAAVSTPSAAEVSAARGAANVAAGMAAIGSQGRAASSVPSGFGDSAGLGVMPASYDYDSPMPVASSSESTPMPVAAAPLVTASAAPAAIPVPMTQRKSVPLVDLRRGVGADAAANVASGVAAGANAAAAANVAAQAEVAAQTAVPEPQADLDPYGVGLGGAQVASRQAPAATCLLIDRQTGRTFTGTAPSTIIGRERSQCGIVLRDPNVSRRHAELRYDGRDWHIIDLRSTNGTLVNDVDVDECILRDGDLLTLGLINLEFREIDA